MTSYISLSEAALRAQRSYNQMHRLLMTGTIKGRRSADGRLEVERNSLDRYLSVSCKTQDVSNAEAEDEEE